MDEKKLLEEYVNAREKKDLQKKLLTESEDALEAAEARLIEFLESQNKKDTGMYPGIGKVSITAPQVCANCTEENKDACFGYLRFIGREDLIKQVVNSRSLSALTKTIIEAGQDVPDCISYYLKPSVKFTRS